MVAELVRRARRRFLANEILAQFAWALSAGFGAVILLLLLGTEILSWHWLVLLPAGTFGLGLYRTWRRLPTLYGVAQLVDRRLGLADTLSTALHFSSGEPGMPVSEEICLAQQAQAERLAAAAVVEQAVPLRMPRAVYATLLLGCVASSLFALRYGLDRRLDLRPPLARVVMDAMGLGRAPGKWLWPKRSCLRSIAAPFRTPWASPCPTASKRRPMLWTPRRTRLWTPWVIPTPTTARRCKRRATLSPRPKHPARSRWKIPASRRPPRIPPAMQAKSPVTGSRGRGRAKIPASLLRALSPQRRWGTTRVC